MRIDIQSNHLEISQILSDSIKAKVGKLEHFYENILDAIVYLHEENDHKEVEIKINVKDHTLFIKESADTFQAALDIAVDVMKKQLKKYKEKHIQA